MISSLLKRAVIAIFPVSSKYVTSSSTQAAMIINGSFEVSHRVIMDKLTINGKAKLGPDTFAEDSITVNGTLEASGTSFQSELVVNGPSKLEQCKINHTSHFSGVVNAIGSQFFKDLKLRTHKSSFSNCKLDTMTVQEIPFVTKQVIHLKNGSLVAGDVTFESGHGEVVIDESSNVQGMVYGGTKITC